METEERIKIGWVGSGVMGSSMCGHLLDAGYPVQVFSRTQARADALLERGARWASSPAEAASGAEVVFTMVGLPTDVREVVLGPEGTLSHAEAGTTLVDMTTSQPSLAREIALLARARAVESIDAPVSGGDIGARNATLSIMVGGEREAFDRVLPLFELMGKTIEYQGEAGAGQHTKMVNQILIATGMIGVCEALLYAFRAGLDLDGVLRSVGGGAAGSWSLSNYAPRILKHDYEPGFRVEHFLKDMEIALSEARQMNLALPGLALANQLYLALRAQGGGAKGTQALVLALAKLSDVPWD